jgi:hypothetical protein
MPLGLWSISVNTVKSIHFAYFHSITKYGIIFWGNSFNRGKIFTLKKKLATRMSGAQPRCRYRAVRLLVVRTLTTENWVQSEQEYVGSAVDNLPVGHFFYEYYGLPLSGSFHQYFKRIHSSVKDTTRPWSLTSISKAFTKQ